MRVFQIGMYMSGGALFMLASLANIGIGVYALFHYFGALALLGILFFPITVAFYPFIIWGLEGETVYLAVWGGLWGVCILAAALNFVGERLTGTEE